MPPPRQRPATSSEVARRAGVSRTTVSFVLNKVADQTISEDTRQRVLAAANELGYEPHAGARSLAGGQTGTVALVLPKAAHLYADAFIGQLVASVNEECHRHGLALLIESTEDEGRDPGGFMKLVRSRRIDGLIVVNLRPSDHDHLRRIRDAGVPLVVFGCGLPALEPFHTVGTDSRAWSARAVTHLLDLGHRRVAFVSFAPPDFYIVNDREDGWRDALLARGLEPDPGLCAYGDISAESGYLATQQLLATRRDFTALFAGNDTIAFGALRALREAGLRVPQDVAVMGYDDIPLAAYADPPLSTVHSDPIGHGLGAMQMLLGQLRGAAGGAPEHRALGLRLVIRESCGASLAKPG